LSNQNILTQRYEDALLYATRLHTNQLRKGSSIPYLTHLLSVSALVLENGGDEDQAIAALLHDAVEDQGGIKTLNEIKEKFGNRVAYIVEGCSDSFETPKPPWRKRKEAYIEHLQSADEDILLVSMADKLHNARSILSDLKSNGKDIWKRFTGGRNGTLWYYRSLDKILGLRYPSRMQIEFSDIVKKINTLADSEKF
jgi:(p)ppGpp synthase/HD superfamily hydrolase